LFLVGLCFLGVAVLAALVIPRGAAMALPAEPARLPG
jgi:hypothetical protein